VEQKVALFLDLGTEKLHIAARGHQFSSWPDSRCGISRKLGRPKTFWEREDWCAAEICKRCLRASEKETK
jgi:hypothetical protein